MPVKAGSSHTVVENDWLSKLSGEAYGDIFKWNIIADANPQINGRGVAVDGSPLIFPGDVLWIPEEIFEDNFDDVLTESFAEQQEESFSIAINGENVAVIKGEFVKTMDTASDSVSFDIDPDGVTDTIREALKPFRYPLVTLKINGELQLTGYLYVVDSSVESDKRLKSCTVYSKTANLIDSSVNPPYEQRSVSLKGRAETLCRDLGISVTFAESDSKVWDKVTARSGQKRFDHLVSLAQERGLLISCTAEGGLLFHKANSDGVAVDALVEGEKGALSFSCVANGRERFSSYRITGKTIDKQPVSKTVVDEFVPVPRYFCKKMSRSSGGTVTTAAEWERSKAIADALSISTPVDRWSDKSGKLWSVNSFITVKSKTLDLESGTDLLIRRVKFSYSSSGKTAILDLVPKEVFLGGSITDIWS